MLEEALQRHPVCRKTQQRLLPPEAFPAVAEGDKVRCRQRHFRQWPKATKFAAARGISGSGRRRQSSQPPKAFPAVTEGDRDRSLQRHLRQVAPGDQRSQPTEAFFANSFKKPETTAYRSILKAS